MQHQKIKKGVTPILCKVDYVAIREAGGQEISNTWCFYYDQI
jgi:hypothetical protein